MPWNAKPEAGRLGPGIPKSHFWASDPGGIDQVGCVYTAQGFEFDYVGVIFGSDLVYRRWMGVGRPARQSHDRVVRRGVTEDEFTELRQEHLPGPAYAWPPWLLRLLHGRADARLLSRSD